MFMVVINAVVLLELVSTVLTDLTVSTIVQCMDGVSTAGVDACWQNLCEDPEVHHDRLFIVQSIYGVRCEENPTGIFGMRFAICIVKQDNYFYTAFPDASLNDLRSLKEYHGPDDESEVWNICTYLAGHESEWTSYQKVKPVTGRWDSMIEQYKKGAYNGTATESDPSDGTVESLLFKATNDRGPSSTPVDAYTIEDTAAFTEKNTCEAGMGTNGIDGVTHFAHGMALYSCVNVTDGHYPQLIGCLTTVENVALEEEDKELEYLKTDDLNLRRTHSFVRFVSKIRKMGDGKMMTPNQLCEDVYDALKENEHLFDVESNYKPDLHEKVIATMLWHAPLFSLE